MSANAKANWHNRKAWFHFTTKAQANWQVEAQEDEADKRALASLAEAKDLTSPQELENE